MASGEFEIVARHFRDSGLSFDSSGVDLSIGDDCALLDIAHNKQLAISMDVLQENVHFPATAEPGLLGQRALAVNLSDLAAMGADPFCFTLGLSLPEADDRWLQAFSRGLLKMARRYSCPLVGGDLIRGNLQIAIQVHGQIGKGDALLRSGARPGHLVYVTGTLGDAAAALALLSPQDFQNSVGDDKSVFSKTRLSSRQKEHFIDAFYRPSPGCQ